MEAEAPKESNETNPIKDTTAESTDIKNSLFRLNIGLVNFFKKVANIKEGTDYESTAKGIKADSEFSGHRVWILVLSIFIASIGLNVNSTAVIIGAMLISPLMGPILGVGLSIGTNDFQKLINSLKSFGTMTLIAVIASTFYFFITPLDDVQSELIARTKPTILDVLIAICGGLAGIIAGSRSEKSNVVPGVAIATALMPPLCTAGFGLANGNWNFFFGGFYLFLLNSVFIAISTFVMVRFLGFPLAQFLDKQKEKRVKQYITLFVLVVIIPSGWIFVDVIKESIFKQRADAFVRENVNFKGTEIINNKLIYSDTLKAIELFVIGELISDREETALRDKLEHYKLEEAKLFIYQSKDQSGDIAGKLSQEVKAGILEDIYEKNAAELENKEQKIRFLENQLIRFKKDSIPFRGISKEIKLQYEDVEQLALSKAITTKDGTDFDTIPTLLVRWKGDDLEVVNKNEEKLGKWLKLRLELDTLNVVRY